MPTLSRYFIRSSLLCMAIGYTIGGLILAAKADAVSPSVWAWLPMHMALLLGGWLLQLSIGVAYWILPRMSGAERGRRRWAWAAFVIFQIGVAANLLALLALWWAPFQPLLAIAVILQSAAVGLFAIHAWPRIHAAIVRATTKPPIGRVHNSDS